MITDFGLAHKIQRKTSSSEESKTVYTPDGNEVIEYEKSYEVKVVKPQPVFSLAPEVLNQIIMACQIELTKSSDIYMLGCALLELAQNPKFVPFLNGRTVVNKSIQYRMLVKWSRMQQAI